MEPSRGQAAQKTKVLLPLLLVLLLSSPERFDALPKTTQRELPVSVPSSAALATRSCFTPSAPKGVPGGTRGLCSRTEPPMPPGPETCRKPPVSPPTCSNPDVLEALGRTQLGFNTETLAKSHEPCQPSCPLGNQCVLHAARRHGDSFAWPAPGRAPRRQGSSSRV